MIQTDNLHIIPFDSQSFRRYSFFNFAMNPQRATHFSFKPELTPEEKELLKHLLSALKLDFDEFKLKLKELNVPLKSFIKSIKSNVLTLGIAPPQQNPEIFLRQVKEYNLIPEKLFEKLHQDELEQNQELGHQQTIRPSPFSTKLRRK